MTRSRKGLPEPTEIAPGVHRLPLRGVNVYLLRPGPSWVLIDTAWRNSAPAIRAAAESLFGPDSPPQAILLTHPHGDHVGSAVELARTWDVPIYIHALDLPLLSATPELAAAARALPCGDAGVPGLPDWECIPTPGHSPGSVAFFRRSDRVLIVGDALLTVRMAGLPCRRHRISPPLRLPSWDWKAVKASVAVLAALEPAVLASGHGIPMSGPGVAGELRAFSERFSKQ